MRRRVPAMMKVLGWLVLAGCVVAASVALVMWGLSCVLSRLLPLLALIV